MNRPTLDKPLCEAAAAMEQQPRLLDLSHLLRVLWHHHKSQAKPHATRCSREYHALLAQRLGAHLDGTPLVGTLQELIDRRKP